MTAPAGMEAGRGGAAGGGGDSGDGGDGGDGGQNTPNGLSNPPDQRFVLNPTSEPVKMFLLMIWPCCNVP